MPIRIKRVYDPPSEEDGLRILVDRLWPRGLRKSEARIDIWLKDIAPSSGLRKWFGHRRDRWDEFRRRYFIELEEKKDLINVIVEESRERNVTLLFGARNRDLNNAVALKDYIETEILKMENTEKRSHGST